MKMIDACLNVNKSEENTEFDWAYHALTYDDMGLLADIGVVGSNIQVDDIVDSTRLVAYPLKGHWCTDQMVGIDVVYLDGEFVLYTSTRSRNDDIKIVWRDAEHRLKFINFISEFKINPDAGSTFMSPDEEIEEYYHVEYFQQFRHIQTVGLMHDGVEITVDREKTAIRRGQNFHTYDGIVILKNGVEEIVPAKEIMIPIAITK